MVHHPVIAVAERAALIPVSMAGRIAGSAGRAATLMHHMTGGHFLRRIAALRKAISGGSYQLDRGRAHQAKSFHRCTPYAGFRAISFQRSLAEQPAHRMLVPLQARNETRAVRRRNAERKANVLSEPSQTMGDSDSKFPTSARP